MIAIESDEDHRLHPRRIITFKAFGFKISVRRKPAKTRRLAAKIIVFIFYYTYFFHMNKQHNEAWLHPSSVPWMYVKVTEEDKDHA